MSKLYKSTIIIMAIIMILSYLGIGVVFERFFAEWYDQMGILAFIFNIIVTALIGFVFSLLTERKLIESDDVINDLYETEVKDERNIMLRGKAGLSMWRINFFLLLALTLLMIALKISIAAWCILTLIAINLIGYFISFYIEDNRH